MTCPAPTSYQGIKTRIKGVGGGVGLGGAAVEGKAFMSSMLDLSGRLNQFSCVDCKVLSFKERVNMKKDFFK